jgi:hypothetical protein
MTTPFAGVTEESEYAAQAAIAPLEAPPFPR